MLKVIAAAALLALPARGHGQPARAPRVPAVGVRVILGVGCEAPDTVRAESFDLEMMDEPGSTRSGGVLRLVRTPDAQSDALHSREARAGGARLEVDSSGVRILTARLDGVSVRAYRLVAAPPDLSVESQRLAIEETLAQLRADHAESVRALETIEALDKQRVTARLDLPRARERVATLVVRVQMQQERLATLDRAAARRRILEERVTLGFTSLALRDADAIGPCVPGARRPARP